MCQEVVMTQRIGFRLWVKPGRLAEYKRLHLEVWPELLRDLKNAGARNYSIFSDNLELFGYLECDDRDAFNDAMAKSSANRRWQLFMSDYLATPIDPGAASPLRVMEEVFRLD
jgi:L-rhamnose mutarotase